MQLAPQFWLIDYFSAIELNNSIFLSRIAVDALPTPIYHAHGIDFFRR
jgi:hypothetical protein